MKYWTWQSPNLKALVNTGAFLLSEILFAMPMISSIEFQRANIGS